MHVNTWNVPKQGGRVWARQMDGGGSDGFNFQMNSTSSIINDLKFAVTKSVRSTFIILACFNIAAAVATALGVFWDCYSAAGRSDPTFRPRHGASWRTLIRRAGQFRTYSSFLSVIGTAEVVPFVVSIGIVAQGIVYVVAQAKGLEGLLILGCSPISQAMLPALFVVPYTQLVFGFETVLQALRRRPFPRRSKWTVPTCLVIVVAGLVGTYLVTRFIEPPNFCYASLFWFVQTWRLESFGMLTGIASALLIGAVIIFTRLRRNTAIDAVERVAASRMVYFMVLGTILNGLIAPFFYSISFQNPLALNPIQFRLFMVAMVSGNISGFAFGVLYIFLRSSKMRTIGPRGHMGLGGLLQPESSVQIWAPAADNIYNTQMAQPVSPPRLFESSTGSRRSSTTGREKFQRNGSSDGYRTGERVNEPVGSNMTAMASTPVVQPWKTHARKKSYTLFPNRWNTSDTKSKGHHPATTYATTTSEPALNEAEVLTDVLLPPPKVHAPRAIRHRRGSSLVSSATVQIGLRVSNVSDVTHLDSPVRQQSIRPSGLQGLDSPIDPALVIKPLSIRLTTPRISNTTLRDSNNANKQYPPLYISTRWRGDDGGGEEEQVTLNPTVYNPLENSSRANISNHDMAASSVSLPSQMLASGDRFKVETAEWI